MLVTWDTFCCLLHFLLLLNSLYTFSQTFSFTIVSNLLCKIHKRSQMNDFLNDTCAWQHFDVKNSCTTRTTPTLCLSLAYFTYQYIHLDSCSTFLRRFMSKWSHWQQEKMQMKKTKLCLFSRAPDVDNITTRFSLARTIPLLILSLGCLSTWSFSFTSK